METTEVTQRYVDVVGLAARYGVSRAHIYRMMHAGMPSVTLGRVRRFDTVATDAWLAEQSAS